MLSVTVLYEGKTRRINLDKRVPVREVLESIGINPETVIVRRGNEIIPDNEKISDKDRIEALKVVSGG